MKPSGGRHGKWRTDGIEAAPPPAPTRTRQSLTRKSEGALSRDSRAWDQVLHLTAVKPPQHKNRNAATFSVSETIVSPLSIQLVLADSNIVLGHRRDGFPDRASRLPQRARVLPRIRGQSPNRFCCFHYDYLGSCSCS
jgi:hypothetical protein